MSPSSCSLCNRYDWYSTHGLIVIISLWSCSLKSIDTVCRSSMLPFTNCTCVHHTVCMAGVVHTVRQLCVRACWKNLNPLSIFETEIMSNICCTCKIRTALHLLEQRKELKWNGIIFGILLRKSLYVTLWFDWFLIRDESREGIWATFLNCQQSLCRRGGGYLVLVGIDSGLVGIDSLEEKHYLPQNLSQNGGNNRQSTRKGTDRFIPLW